MSEVLAPLRGRSSGEWLGDGTQAGTLASRAVRGSVRFLGEIELPVDAQEAGAQEEARRFVKSSV